MSEGVVGGTGGEVRMVGALWGRVGVVELRVGVKGVSGVGARGVVEVKKGK